jgi:hypothetical protein
VFLSPLPLNVEVVHARISLSPPHQAAVHGRRYLCLGLRFLPRPSPWPLSGKGRQACDRPQPNEDKLIELSVGIEAPMSTPTSTRPVRHPWLTWAASLLFLAAAIELPMELIDRHDLRQRICDREGEREVQFLFAAAERILSPWSVLRVRATSVPCV